MARRKARSARKTSTARKKPTRRKPRPKARARKRPAAARAKRRPAARPSRRSAPAAAGPAPSHNAIGALVQHMDYTTHAIEEVKRFYTEHLGFSEFNFDEKASYLSVVTGPSSSLGFMPPMPGPPEQWRPPREPAVYLIVQDVDRAHRDLIAKGLTFEQEPTDMFWGHRLAILRDPEGRTVCLAQVLNR
jgi:catechol 2,3-dioxygenase-like lactoylglutathione lyase family enzyme